MSSENSEIPDDSKQTLAHVTDIEAEIFATLEEMNAGRFAGMSTETKKQTGDDFFVGKVEIKSESVEAPVAEENVTESKKINVVISEKATYLEEPMSMLLLEQTPSVVTENRNAQVINITMFYLFCNYSISK